MALTVGATTSLLPPNVHSFLGRPGLVTKEATTLRSCLEAAKFLHLNSTSPLVLPTAFLPTAPSTVFFDLASTVRPCRETPFARLISLAQRLIHCTLRPLRPGPQLPVCINDADFYSLPVSSVSTIIWCLPSM